MQDSNPSLSRELAQLLQETVSAHISPSSRVVHVTSRPIIPGMSGASVRRHELVLEEEHGFTRRVRLVTKAADLRERRVLAMLTAQRQASVPFSHTLDLTTEAPRLICLQDLGDTRRPTSRDPITEEELRREAEGLAAIHAANLGRSPELAWLPRTDRAYFADVIERWWRPHWLKAWEDRDFRNDFGPFMAPVEEAAERLVGERVALADQGEALTLIHGDINPSNVLVHDGRPYYIDWQVAQYGLLYLDLPHHFCTLRQAEHYRRALAERGVEIPASEFVARYRAAARCIGFRYMWWTLENWQADHRETAWVMHYIHLVLGNV
jgi:thiamine kinase-like enzyme